MSHRIASVTMFLFGVDLGIRGWIGILTGDDVNRVAGLVAFPVLYVASMAWEKGSAR